MVTASLILYSRKGCCLCEGLEQRLRTISLHQLKPPLILSVVDIDDVSIPPEIRGRYDVQVPVMVLRNNDRGLKEILELPRVSPRLNGEALFMWLQRILTKTFE